MVQTKMNSILCNNFLNTSVSLKVIQQDDVDVQPPIKDIKLEPGLENENPQENATEEVDTVLGWASIEGKQESDNIESTVVAQEECTEPDLLEILEESMEILRLQAYKMSLKKLKHFLTFMPRNILYMHKRLIQLNSEYQQIKAEYMRKNETEVAQNSAFNTLKLYIEQGPSAVPNISFDEVADAMIKQEPMKREVDAKRIKLEDKDHEIRLLQCQLNEVMNSYSRCFDFVISSRCHLSQIQRDVHAYIDQLIAEN